MNKVNKVLVSLIVCGSVYGCGGGGEPSTEAPVDNRKLGVLVFVHGGGWVSSPPVLPAPSTKGLPELAQELQYDYTTLTYPLATDTYYSFPEAHKSIVSQLKFLRNQYKNIYVIGSSAGANIVALAAIEDPNSMDKAALYYGVYDLPAMDDDFNSKYSYKYTQDLYAASPAHLQQMTVKHHLWHGTKDTLVPYSQSVNYDYNKTTLVDAHHGFNLIEYTGEQLKCFLTDTICAGFND